MARAQPVVQAEQSSPSTKRTHLVGLDGLRGLAAVTVMTGHVYQHLSSDFATSGWPRAVLSQMGQGLTLFFALSGFLLYLPFMRSLYAERRAPSTSRFYFNRVVRIYPAHLVVLLISSYVLAATYVTSPPAHAVGVDGERGMMTDPLQVLANVALVQTLIPSTMGTGLGVSWSLTAELCFYLVLPALAGLAYVLSSSLKSSDLGALTPPALLFLVGAGANVLADANRTGTPAEQYAASWGQTWQAVFERSLIGQAALFAVGMFTAVLVARVSDERFRRLVARVRWWLLAACLLTPVTVALLPPTLAFATSCAALIGFTALPARSGKAGRLACVLEWRPVYFVGLVSYSFYLWHAMVINIVRRHALGFDAGSVGGFVGNWILVFTVTLLLATATYHAVERPCMRLRRRARLRAA